MKFKKNSGQIIIEVLFSVALFSLVAFSVAVILKDGLEVLTLGMEKQRAIYLAKEGMEALESIAKDNFEQLKDGSFFLEFLGGNWEISDKEEKIEKFSRKINLEGEKDFEELKKGEVKIEWESPLIYGKNSLSLFKYFVNPKTFALELDSQSYVIGEPSPWEGQNYSIFLSLFPKTALQENGAGLFASKEEAGNTLLQIESDGNLNYQLRIGNKTFLIGEIKEKWTQIGITFDGSYLRIYYDGKESSSQSLSLDEGRVEFSRYLLGTSFNKQKGFSGIYKNLIIFDRSLNQNEISDLFSGKIPSSDGLRLYWKMVEGEGDSIKDFSSYNVSGKITGQILWKKIFNFSVWKEVGDF